MVDNDGTDAIWIQETGSVGTFGHSGLMVQNDAGEWFYFFWGPESAAAVVFSSKKYITAKCVLKKIDVDDYNMSYLVNVQITLNRSESSFVRSRADKVTGTVYFKGDYSKTYEWLKDLNDNLDRKGYNLIENNCAQISAEALRQSNSDLGILYSCIPNEIYHAIIFLPHYYPPISPWSLPSKTHIYPVTQ